MSEDVLQIRRIESEDDAKIARLIREVMPEFGANGPGFAIADPEVDFMSRAYSEPGCGYWALVRNDIVLGGVGYAPLVGADASICELRKMYFDPSIRGCGLGSKLLTLIIDAARHDGYRSMYLETLESMTAAQLLYERFGFERLDGPMGATGHFGCDRWYAKKL